MEDIVKWLSDKKAVAVMDRACSFGGIGGPLFHEIRHILYDSPGRPPVVNYIYGLGGRDTPPNLIRQVYQELQKIAETKRIEQLVKFIGLRE